MYPDMLHALARARQAEYLRDREFRESTTDVIIDGTTATRKPIGRLRYRTGGVLVAAGARLAGQRYAVEFAPHQH